MNTRTPISTISWNTPQFLIDTLERLTKNHILSEWYFIHHLPEDDESQKREHFHVFMVPSKQIQTDNIRDMFIELDPQKPDKPRKVGQIRNSKFGDWAMYALHDRLYLAYKGIARRYEYKYSDFVSSDYDILFERFSSINLADELGPFYAMAEAKKIGLTFQEFFNHGSVPIQLVRQYEMAWEMIDLKKTYRGDRENHDADLIDL